jgi:hypothetical protein
MASSFGVSGKWGFVDRWRRCRRRKVGIQSVLAITACYLKGLYIYTLRGKISQQLKHLHSSKFRDYSQSQLNIRPEPLKYSSKLVHRSVMEVYMSKEISAYSRPKPARLARNDNINIANVGIIVFPQRSASSITEERNLTMVNLS